MDKAGAGLNVIDLLVVAFPEGFAELRLHLGHAGFPQFIKFQVDLSQKGFQAGNTAVRGQGVLRIEVAYVAPDRFRGPVVFLEHFRR